MTREFTLGSFFDEGVRNNCVAIIASTVWCFGGSSFLVNESDESVRNNRAAIIASTTRGLPIAYRAAIVAGPV